MSNETQPLLIQVSEANAEVLDSYASATDQTPDEAMQLLIEDGVEQSQRDSTFLLDLLEDCQKLINTRESVVLH